jgi:predicted AAA+ superfamily ATPase
LSDRFGITLTYLSPNQVEYLIIVEQLAIKNKISLPLEQLQAAALRWERQHNGRSGRTGQQFINHLLSQR